jgi:agmatinase
MYAGHQHPPLSGEEGAQGWFDLDLEQWQMVGVTMADCGDVIVTPEGGEEIPGKVINTDRLTAAVRKILEKKSFPVIIGGDHTLTTPIVKACEEYEPLDIVHFDAHLDWYDVYHGSKITDADCMTRCAEFPFVRNITQIGMAPYNRLHRGGDYEQYEKAKAYGAKIITAEKFREIGAKKVIDSIPEAENIYVTIDIDCMDAAYVPGCSAMTVGGLSYLNIRDVIRGIPSRGKVVGFDINDLQPARDPINRSAKLVSTLILDFLAAIFPSKK